MKKSKNKPQIKFIFVDVGGVLLNWHGLFKNISVKHNRAIQDVEKAFYKYDTLSCIGKITTKNLWMGMMKELNITAPIEDFENISMEAFYPIKETHDFIKKISQHFSIGLLTNIHRGFLKSCLYNGYIPDIDYHTIIESCEIGMVKPQKEIYLHAQKKTGVNAENILFIDDYIENVDGAKKAGWFAVQFDTLNPGKSVRKIESYIQNHS